MKTIITILFCCLFFLFIATMKIRAEDNLSQLAMLKSFPDSMDVSHQETIKSVIDLAGKTLSLGLEQEVSQIATLFGNGRHHVSVQSYFAPLLESEKKDYVLKWLKISYVNDELFEKEFFEELGRRDLSYSEVAVFREKYYQPQESAFCIGLQHETFANGVRPFITSLVVENMLGIDELIVGVKDNKISNLSLYKKAKFEDAIQVYSTIWDENGNVISDTISPIYTLEEFQKTQMKAQHEVLKRKR